MSELKITGQGINLNALNNSRKPAGEGFGSVLNEAIMKVAEVQNEAEKALNVLGSGGDLTQAVIAMEKADMSFQVMLEVRNKLLNAYEEIMRMQV